MKHNDTQLGKPITLFNGTTSEIEALTPIAGMIAFDTTLDKSVIYDGVGWNEVGSSGGASAFTDLTDVPSAYTDQAGKVLAVNSGETALEFVTPTSGSGSNFVVPISTNFSWLNQGAATVANETDAMYMYAPAVSGWQVRALVKTAPSTPYSIDTYVKFGIVYGENYVKAGIILRNSSDGKCIVFSVGYESQWCVAVTRLNSITDYAGGDKLVSYPLFVTAWLRIKDDGTNRHYYISYDQKRFIEIHSSGNTDWCTPNQVGLFVNSENDNNPCGANFMHWKES